MSDYAPPDYAPSLDDLRRAAVVCNGFPGIDRTWLALTQATAPAIDLSRADHRALLLPWLNSWGCRIRYPRAGEPAPFDAAVADWWRSWRSALPAVSLARLSDAGIEAVGGAYAALAAAPVSTGRARRTLGSTAAAKALYAMAPRSIMPWDAAIAARLHGARDDAAFRRHLRLGREWAVAIIAQAGLDEDAIPALVGRPAVSLAKVIDEYLYVAITMRGQGARPDAGVASGDLGALARKGAADGHRR